MKRFLANLFIRLNGWQMDGVRPKSDKIVIIAAPHTSNWDLAYLLAFAVLFDLKISWIGKHTLFKWPIGWLMIRLGGIPVRRHLRENMVDQMARVFGERDQMALIVPTEGTRGYVPYWKSGFYHIARTAGVPIVMGFLDYGAKRGGFGEEFLPSGDLKADMDRVRAFYVGKTGRYPEHFGPIRLRDEEGQAGESTDRNDAAREAAGTARGPAS